MCFWFGSRRFLNLHKASQILLTGQVPGVLKLSFAIRVVKKNCCKPGYRSAWRVGKSGQLRAMHRLRAGYPTLSGNR